jgi:hypothetical protein
MSSSGDGPRPAWPSNSAIVFLSEKLESLARLGELFQWDGQTGAAVPAGRTGQGKEGQTLYASTRTDPSGHL